MNTSITLSRKEAAQVYQILKAFDEGLIVNPSEERELDHYDEKIADRDGLKKIMQKIEESLPPEESEKTRKREIDVYHKTRKYVIGYCHLRKAIRKFRTSRIVTVRLTAKDYKLPDNFDKNKY